MRISYLLVDLLYHAFLWHVGYSPFTLFCWLHYFFVDSIFANFGVNLDPFLIGGSIAKIHARDGATKVGQPTVGISLNARDGAVKVGQPTVGMSLHSPRNSKGLLESSARFEKKSKQCNFVRTGMDIGKSDMNIPIENLERATTNSGNNDEYAAKKKRSNSLCLNSMSSNTVEAAILDLEELVNRIKWLKDVLKMRVPLPGIKRSSWKFLQHHASCK